MRSTRVVLTALTFSVVSGLVASLSAWGAATGTPQTLQVRISATEPSGPQGLGILSPEETATAVQVLITGAPEGVIATIHAGTCADLGSEVVGLIGQLNPTGQAQATVPVPFATLADGAHAIALHPGLDLASTMACGSIPAVAGLPSPAADLRSPAVAPTPVPPAPTPVPPAPTPVPPAPTVDPACVGIPEWLAATRDRLEQLAARERDLSRVANDPVAYTAALREQLGRIDVMIEQMRQEAVPAAALSNHQKLIAALESGVRAAQDVLQAFATSDPTLYQQAIRTATEANTQVGEVRVAVGELDARCVPAT